MNQPSPFRPPRPPYVAVVFTSQRTPGDNGYAAASDKIFALVRDQPGFLGVDSARGADGLGITVSYWRDEESVAAWSRELAHRAVKQAGRDAWYTEYAVHMARVERAWGFTRDTDG
jgi:heme-degrading monooxygenase HmoA